MPGPISQFIDHHYRHFNAAALIDAAEAYVQFTDAGNPMFLTMAGAMSTAELGISLAEMIRRGKVSAITASDNGASVVEITADDGSKVSETVPAGPTVTVAVGDVVAAGAALTNDPNVGGFGQLDAEVVLQNPVRIYGLLAFFAAIALAQIMLVLKKRQVEKVQAAEGF